MRVLFTSRNLIGDGLYISSALRKWILSKLPDGLNEICLLTLDDHITPLYPGMIRDLPYSFNVVFERPEGLFNFEHEFNVGKAFILSDQKRQHVATSYAELLGVDIGADIGPHFIPSDLSVPTHEKGMILLSMFSASDSSQNKENPLPPNKMLPWPKWKPMLNTLRESYPDTPIRILGAPNDDAKVPDDFQSFLKDRHIQYMLAIPLNRLAAIMREAKLLVTIDNGMSHLAASQQCPTFLMYPRCLGSHYILPIGNKNLLTWAHIDPVHVNPNQLRHALAYAIAKLNTKGKV